MSQRIAEAVRDRGGVWASTRWVPEYGGEFTDIKWERERTAAHAAGRPEPEPNFRALSVIEAMGWATVSRRSVPSHNLLRSVV